MWRKSRSSQGLEIKTVLAHLERKRPAVAGLFASLPKRSEEGSFGFAFPEKLESRDFRIGRSAQNDERARSFLHQFGNETLKDGLIEPHILADDRAFAEHRFARFVSGLFAAIEE